MRKDHHGLAERQVRSLFQGGVVAGLTDAQLLDRWTEHGGFAAESAFSAIVERHGPMVLRVCRRTIGDEHAAEDAFQATFLILAQKARSLRRRSSLASWLHGIALRVSRRARDAAHRRRTHEARAAVTIDTPGAPERSAEAAELNTILHGEIERLPEWLRSPILLCDWEGLDYGEAARILGCPVGTLKSRLARGRRSLRSKLVRRGVVSGAVTLAVSTARASVPDAIRESTLRAVFPGRTPPQAVRESVRVLTEEVLRSMSTFRLMTATVAGSLTSLALCVAFAVAPDGTAGEAFASPVRDSPVSSTVLPSDQPSSVDQVLSKLAQARAGLTSLDVRLTVLSRSPFRADEKQRGRLILSSLDRVAFEVSGPLDAMGKESVSSRRVWTGGDTHIIVPEKRQVIISKKFGPREILTLPFLWTLSEAEIRRRYRVTLVNETPDFWVLSLVPVQPDEKAVCSKMFLKVDRKSCRADRSFLISPDGRSMTDIRYSDVQINTPVDESLFCIPSGEDWTVVNDRLDPSRARRVLELLALPIFR